MPRLIAHRGFWWPNQRRQNHPSALNAALQRGWDVEVDVWRTHGTALKVGHDRPEYEWSLPSLDIGHGHLFLHLKGASTEGYPWSIDMEERIREVIEKAGWGCRSVRFVSPPKQEVPQGLPFLNVVKDVVDLSMVSAKASGVWVEQESEDWITARDIEAFSEDFPNHIVPLYVLSSEIHGRQINLGKLMEWGGADGIVTDMPHLLEQIFDSNNAVVHPREAWW